jgi:lambda family phage portal protein
MALFSELYKGPPAKQRGRRGAAFPAADLGRLTSTWNVNLGSINRWLRYELRTMRSRSRQLCRGDAYASKFVDACRNNIAGPTPFQLQAQVKFNSGRLNATANEAIETAYVQWSKPGRCDVTGKLSLAEMDRLTIMGLARDGEALWRRLVDANGVRYQLLDIDRLDELRNDNLPDGAIKMGVEVDLYGRPRAYHILKDHPGELGEWSRGNERVYERVQADQVLHLFIPDWPEQVRGFPWMHAAMIRLWHLGAFEEAAVINARVGASKLAILQSPNGEPPASMATGRESEGNLLDDAEPGQYWTLPEGYELKEFNPTFPDAAIEPFVRSLLRGVSAAVGMAYHSLANDPGAVNYSTARVALLEERDMWTTMQNWYIEHACFPRLRDFLEIEGLAERLAPAYATQAEQCRFQGKTWKWIDPLKEVNAQILALDSQLTSRTRITAEGGEDFEDVLNEIAAEQASAADKGVLLQSQKPGLAATVPEDPADQAAAQEDAAAGVTTGKKAVKPLNGSRPPSSTAH